MGINEFNDEKKEFIIRDMFPVRPWMNYSWNSEYVSSFDQFGFGISRFCDENGYKKSVLAENDNRLIFIKDRKTNEYFAANRNYDCVPFDVFETRVGMGYSVINSKYKETAVEFKLFVPPAGKCECWEVNVENTGNEEKELSLYAYCELDTKLSPIDGYSKADFSYEIGGIYASHAGAGIPTEYTGVYFVSNDKPCAYETSNRRFKGIYSRIAHPDALAGDKLSCRATCFEFCPAAVMQFDIKLKPSENKKLLFMLGASKSEAEAKMICGDMLSERGFEKSFNEVISSGEDFRSGIRIKTPDEDIDRRANIWLKRQMELGMQWGRLYGKGFRDLMQDTTGFLPLEPEKARERILYSAAYQRENGNPLRQWEPVTEEVYADGAVWLIYAVNAYLKETGDYTILEEQIPYYGSDKPESLIKHCMRGFDYLFDNLGEHGLCLWFEGDWNDSMNACGILGRGESVWLSEAAVKAGHELAEILEHAFELERYDEVLEKTEILKNSILKYGMDGDRFIYGINDYGERIGSDDSQEGRIFLNPQTWAVIAGIVKGETAVKLMDKIEETLACPYGYMQNYPSYSKPDDHIGRVTYFEKGVYENGSVYNHGVAFKAVADCMINDGSRALRTLKMILPSNPETYGSGTEPYVISNMYFGPYNPYRKGDAPLSWITGTGGWIFRCITENILGVQAVYEGLRIAPNMPDEWDIASVSRVFRGVEYNIVIKNNNKAGEYIITADGRELEGNIVPVFERGTSHDIVCER